MKEIKFPIKNTKEFIKPDPNDPLQMKALSLSIDLLLNQSSDLMIEVLHNRRISLAILSKLKGEFTVTQDEELIRSLLN